MFWSYFDTDSLEVFCHLAKCSMPIMSQIFKLIVGCVSR